MEGKNDLAKQEESLIEWPEVIIEMLHSSNLNDRVKQVVELKLKQIESQNTYTKWSSIAHFALSLLVIVGVFILTFFDKLQGQTAATLIGAMVGYLFGRLRR